MAQVGLVIILFLIIIAIAIIVTLLINKLLMLKRKIYQKPHQNGYLELVGV